MTMMPSPAIEYQQHEHLYVKRTVTTGQRLVVIAEANSGEYFEPMHVYHEEMAKRYFTSGPLVDRYMDITSATDTVDIYLMRISPKAYEEAYEYLLAYSFDLIYIDDFNFGNSSNDIVNYLEFAKEKEQRGELIHGFVEAMPFHTFNELEPVFQMIESLSVETQEGTVEEGKFLSVVIDQFKSKSAAAVYAGFVTTLEAFRSPVNKKLEAELAFEFTKEEILILKQMGIVCFWSSIHNGTVCASATCAVVTPGSPHKHISNFRIVQTIIQRLVEELQNYVGRIASAINTRKIDEMLNSQMQEYLQALWIRGYEYSIISDMFEGYLFLVIEVVPVFSIDKITAHSQVRVYQ